MARDHFVPASLIARFSPEEGVPSRTRKVWTLRPTGHRAQVKAESIGYANGLYDVDQALFPTHGKSAVDRVWGSYEGELSGALDRLIQGRTTADEWISTLVPFVAATFARDRGYKKRVAARMSGGHEPKWLPEPEASEMAFDATNIAINRVLEMERFAAKAIASEWTVYYVDGDVLLPDVGFGIDVISENPAVIAQLLPVGPRHILSLMPRPRRRVLTAIDGGWDPCIRFDVCRSPAATVNRALAATAQDFVVGTHSATLTVSDNDLGAFPWSQIDEALSVWPYATDTRQLYGLHRMVGSIVRGEVLSPVGQFLDRYRALADLEPLAALVAPFRPVPADRFLSFDTRGNLRIDVD